MNRRDRSPLATRAASLLLIVLGFAGCGRDGSYEPHSSDAQFVDEQACASCHADERARWQGSHHDLAMQAVSERTVLGDFNDVRFASHGLVTRFSRRGGKFVVTTDGPDGRLADYEVKYVFGVSPLQQYLLELPGGRLQALSVAWDAKRKRWFHLYPRERIDHRDELHWTRPSQNWNFMCAECHTTGLRKNYDAAKDRYDTTWFRIDVGCQACHGPGSEHVAWAREHPNAKGPSAGAVGLEVDLAAADNRTHIDACGRCHSRRSVIAFEYVYGRPLMDSHLPALLDEGLYYPDGQIREEVYEYDSFLQSPMYQKGVRCSDCHDPHSGTLKAEGNALCARCHNAKAPDVRQGIDASGLKKADYDSPAHHFHAPGKPGSQCIDCHSPRTTYMVVDPRADHSFRIPRPDLTIEIGTPNACNGCHRDRSAHWAASEIARRHPDYRASPHYGEALDAGRRGEPGAATALAKLVEDRARPAIVRATAVELLVRYPGAFAGSLVGDAIRDPDPLVRRAAAASLDSAPREQRVYWLVPMLHDPVRAVRIEAARGLESLPESAIGEADRAAFAAALGELEESHRINQDRAEGRIGLGNFYSARGRIAEAEAAYRSALAFDPVPVPAVVNLADFYRATGREREAEELLRKGIAAHPRNPALSRSLALSLVRQQRKPEALKLLAGAAAADADVAYLYALALADAGRRGEALRVLERALRKSSGSRDILLALASFEQHDGNSEKAAAYLRQLAAINPYDPALVAPR